MTADSDPARRIGRAGGNDGADRLFRFIAWANLFALALFLVQVWITQIMGAPGPGPALAGQGGAVSWILLLLYPVVIVAAWFYVSGTPLVGLREDADRITAFNMWIVRGAFFAVLYVGLADAIISFLRVEGLLETVMGESLASELGRSRFRGPWIHLPLVGLGFLTAFFSRTLGFTWLALLIVVAELLIVVSRFVFSYEQSFMGDLVRFWYASLFLFASAYTLLEEGHVRVDVFYAAMARRSKALVNAVGALALGIVLCWTILILGMGSSASIIMAPLLAFEITQSGFGMYVKYLMAGFLAVFAVTMLLQFCALLLESVADRRGDPGHREPTPASAH
jgi:TRAP-type mannitol/chloroaromatic compound transport system permease small subunit